jgi:hypothetical protein
MECEKKLIGDEAKSSFTFIPFFFSFNSMIGGKSSRVIWGNIELLQRPLNF